MQDLRSLVERHYQNLSTGDVLARTPSSVRRWSRSSPRTIRGLDAFKAYAQALRAAFPDGRHRLTSVVESGSPPTRFADRVGRADRGRRR